MFTLMILRFHYCWTILVIYEQRFKNGNTTQRYSIMILAIMFKEAIKEEIIPEYMYPFNKLTLKKDASKRQFLKKEQFEAIIDYKLQEKFKSLYLSRYVYFFNIRRRIALQ